MSLVERAHRINRAVDDLEAKARTLAQGSFWPERRRPPSFYVGLYVQRLLAHVIQADGVRSFDELALLSEYHHSHFDLPEEDEWVKQAFASSPTLPLTVPPFIAAARRQDAAAGSSIAAEMIADIEGLCRLMTDVDGEYSDDERLLLGTVMKALSGQ
jgi:hypothetical protein